LTLACLGPAAAFAATDSGAQYPANPGGTTPPATGEGSLTTIFAQNNNFAGNSFDIDATTDLTVVGWDINLDSMGASRTIQVWWREGTADGFEQVAAGWSMLGSVSVVGNGIDVLVSPGPELDGRIAQLGRIADSLQEGFFPPPHLQVAGSG